MLELNNPSNFVKTCFSTVQQGPLVMETCFNCSIYKFYFRKESEKVYILYTCENVNIYG